MSLELERVASEPDTDEERDVARISADHAQRMSDLFSRCHAKLVKALVARTHSREEARDIAAQAFAELLSLERPTTVSFLAGYLYRTAWNLATNRVVRGADHRRKELAASYDVPRSSPSPEPMWVAHETATVLQRAIRGLTPRCQMAMRLRFWEELSYDEIVARFAADGVRLNERTIRRYLVQALEHCRREVLASEGPRDQVDE